MVNTRSRWCAVAYYVVAGRAPDVGPAIRQPDQTSTTTDSAVGDISSRQDGVRSASLPAVHRCHHRRSVACGHHRSPSAEVYHRSLAGSPIGGRADNGGREVRRRHPVRQLGCHLDLDLHAPETMAAGARLPASIPWCPCRRPSQVSGLFYLILPRCASSARSPAPQREGTGDSKKPEPDFSGGRRGGRPLSATWS